MTVDTHVHIGTFPSLEDIDAGVREQLKTKADIAGLRTKYPELYSRYLKEDPLDNSSDLLALMDKHDIDQSLVQAKTGIKDDIANDFVSELASNHSRRLIPLMTLPHRQLATGDAADPIALRELAASEIDRCFRDLGMAGCGELGVRTLTSEIHPELIADDLAPIMDVLQEHERPLQIPTGWHQFPGSLYYCDPLWVDEVASRYPTVPIVLTKMGRGMSRFFDSALSVALRNNNVYFDTVDTTGEHLRKAVDMIGAHRIMFGTDWSSTWKFVSHPGDVHTTAFEILDSAGLTAQERSDVLVGTARNVWGLEEIKRP